MKKKNQTGKKLSLKKLQVTKIKNPQTIFGGTGTKDCPYPENASKPGGIGMQTV